MKKFSILILIAWFLGSSLLSKEPTKTFYSNGNVKEEKVYNESSYLTSYLLYYDNEKRKEKREYNGKGKLFYHALYNKDGIVTKVIKDERSL